MIRLLLILVLTFGSYAIPMPAAADQCARDCNSSCQIRRWTPFGDIVIDNPACELHCSATIALLREAKACGGAVGGALMPPQIQWEKWGEAACMATFNAFTQPIVSVCSNYGGRDDNPEMISDPQTLPAMFIQNVERPESLPIICSVMDKVI